MALKHGNDFGVTINAVDFKAYVSTLGFNLSVDTAEVTTPNDAGNKTYLEGNADATLDISGPTDYGSATSDATLFGLIGGGIIATTFEPDNDAAISVTNPTYTQNAILTSYSQTFDVGGALTYSASFQRTGASTRTTV